MYHPPRHRRRLGAKHLILFALLALLGSGGAYGLATGSASAHRTQPSPSPSLPSAGEPSASTSPSGAPPSSAAPSPSASHSGGHAGPTEADFADIATGARADRPRNQRGASTGTFTTRCGRNTEGHRNPDNFIVAPGVQNGAHHQHDYVGNVSTDAFSTADSLRAADTTCANGDKSTYFWPVLRDRTAADNADDPDGNAGRILTPTRVSLTFRGNPAAKVTKMPEDLRVITGDAKAFTNGPANARAQWTCTGAGGRVLTDKYPICPEDSRVVRVLDFPSCWDGANTDSANHRTHIVFPDRATGRCPSGTKPVPQLRMRLTYDAPEAPDFAVDSFPEQLHKPVTDHGDFANFMPTAVMDRAVRCINGGRRCG
ncbi:DUF1996 domain-containing protein [Streptomyces sp. A7024]|uniref:DUF1996 domain-containing protein n=1 Tax=Streptomyces coryli TaxID=1128680 RepID=A0A6G4U9B1_9ACTN|nr:DUF1996 domain-containing protein [Streptomyces coryli]NGN67897.1 DUF1996 domain-containing protein [Streptomyces coryli]